VDYVYIHAYHSPEQPVDYIFDSTQLLMLYCISYDLMFLKLSNVYILKSN